MHRAKFAIHSMALTIAMHFAAPAHAQFTCEDVFRSGLLGVRLSEAHDRITSIEVAWMRIAADLRAGGPPHPHDLQVALQNARDLLHAQGAEIRDIEFEGHPALEIIPRTANAASWNRMAGSMMKNYGTKLIYAPVSLARTNANGGFLSTEASGESHPTVLISRMSLAKGRAERTNLHELKHMALTHRREKNPTIFDGEILLVDESPGAAIVGANRDYKTYMTLQEVATHAQDLANLGAKLVREDAPSTRSEIKEKAQDSLDVVRTARAMREFVATSLIRQLSLELETGPILGEQGPEPQSAYAKLSDGTTVFVDLISPNVVRLQIEGERLLGVIRLKVANTSWLNGLQNGESNAQTVFKQMIINATSEWNDRLRSSSTALGASARALLESPDAIEAKKMAEIASRPRQRISGDFRN